MREFVEEYIEYLVIKRQISKSTQESYSRDLNHLITFLIEQGVEQLNDVEYTHLSLYLKAMRQEGKANSTLSRKTVSIKGFFRYMTERNRIDNDPSMSIMSPKKNRKLPVVMTIEEVETFLEQPDDTLKGIRDKAMLEVLYATGIRVSELVQLEVEDINLSLAFVHCKDSRKERIIPMGRSCQKALEQYIKESRPLLIKDLDENTMFVNLKGKKMTRQGFWKIVKHYAEAAGIDKEITPHILRHSFASHLVQNGADIEAVKEMMGHEDISSTQLYLQMHEQKIKEVYQKNHPRA